MPWVGRAVPNGEGAAEEQGYSGIIQEDWAAAASGQGPGKGTGASCVCVAEASKGKGRVLGKAVQHWALLPRQACGDKRV